MPRLRLESASSAAVRAAILARPRPGPVSSKTAYRREGRPLGSAGSAVLSTLFGQDRALMRVTFMGWLGPCVLLARRPDGSRACGAVPAGSTAAVMANPNHIKRQTVAYGAMPRPPR